MYGNEEREQIIFFLTIFKCKFITYDMKMNEIITMESLDPNRPIVKLCKEWNYRYFLKESDNRKDKNFAKKLTDPFKILYKKRS